jgi:hypothetical protein
MSTRASRLASPAAVAAIAALFAIAPSAGAASGWTRPAVFGGTDVELTPRADIAADGSSAVAWSTPCCERPALVVSAGRADGHFAPPRVIHRGRPSDWSVAAGRGGAFLVAWGDADGLRIAVRTATGRPIVVRRIFATTTSEIASVQAATDPRGGWVIVDFESPKRGSRMREPGVRAISLDRAGRSLGAPQDLGPGQFGLDARQTQALAVDPEGRAILTFTRGEPASFGEGTVLMSARPHGGDFGEPLAVPGPAAEPHVAVGPGGRTAVAVVRTDSCAEAGCFGAPGVALLGAAAPGSPFGPSIVRPYRVFAPTAALTAGHRGLLVFQLKTKPAPFSKEAPVRAVAFATDGTVGPLQTLTPAPANEPVAMPLSSGRAVALWAGRRGIGAALTGPNGRFQKTAAPSGPPPEPGHINPTNRDLHTAGRYAIFAWEGKGRARISIRRF